ncbi:MAG: tRNA uridine-5-carboxymethylaminomethyl(34) synthesis GTPase MnmE [Oscillospiraceae bacterium]|nr:tRNA uridine-5-carboxymethylaminomethyl(34) synthesis GTPase MnmE [Oscillospiraceae bacterium]MBQ9838006.1 tRNA uridine-5-carboxymethylaminomethyl(34) synthesis GTPase MnmE [Oscillospiraceae bacterium]
MSDVIAAVSTGNQISAIGILRLTGEGCAHVAGNVFRAKNGAPLWEAPNRKLIIGTLQDKQGRTIDQCLAVYTRGPYSYTGEDTVEFHCHGSPAVLAAGLEALYISGARPAKRGEFTKRAFLNGQLDLTQAEAVIDLIEADTADAAANAAGQVGGVLQKKLAPVYDDLTNICSHFHAVLDYPDEDIEDFGLDRYESALREDGKSLYALMQTYAQGKILRQGVAAAIVGKPNVGKSSLLNALAGFERVIVTDIPGTTRDTVEEAVMLGSTRLRLIDTAGIRETDDTVEAMGVARSREAAENADLVIFVCDGSQPLTQQDDTVIAACKNAKHAIALINKSDLGRSVAASELPFEWVIPICAKNGEGLRELADVVDRMFAGSAPCDGTILTNARQFDAVRRSHEAILRALQGLELGLTPDAVLTDVEQAMEAMGEVTGATVREDITARIFERFCVGK